MGKRADEIRILTIDRGARRLAEIVDELEARLDVCCPPNPIADPNAAPKPQTDK